MLVFSKIQSICPEEDFQLAWLIYFLLLFILIFILYVSKILVETCVDKENKNFHSHQSMYLLFIFPKYLSYFISLSYIYIYIYILALKTLSYLAIKEIKITCIVYNLEKLTLQDFFFFFFFFFFFSDN